MACSKLSLQQATFDWNSDLLSVTVTNHLQHKFNLTLPQLQKVASAFDDLCNELSAIAKAYRHQESVKEDLKSIDVAHLTSYSCLRLVVRKLSRKIYISCGIYEILRSGRYFYNPETNFRLDFFSDDLTEVCQELERIRPPYHHHH